MDYDEHARVPGGRNHKIPQSAKRCSRARASPGAAGVRETGHVPSGPVIVISGPGSVGFSGVTVRPGDLSVLSI